MTAAGISQARKNLLALVRQVNADDVVIEIVARSGGNAVLMSAEITERSGGVVLGRGVAVQELAHLGFPEPAVATWSPDAADAA